MKPIPPIPTLLTFLFLPLSIFAATAGKPGSELTIAKGGKVQAVVVVSAEASEFEAQAAADLAKYIGMMTGGEAKVVNKAPGKGKTALLVGQVALDAKPDLKGRIAAKLKKKPFLLTEGIAAVRDGKRVYLAGNTDRAHYYAVADLLEKWGCRWYLPTDFGECIPEEKDLLVGQLDHVYSPPFEIRNYWISWVGDRTGQKEFQLRNKMTGRQNLPSCGHALGKYTKGLGKGTFHFPITDPKTAEHVASKIAEKYAKGENISIGMEDGSYDSDYPKDQELMKLQYDKYFMRESVTDLMLELYNNVAKILREKHPDSQSWLGFLAYANMTIPPVRDMTAEPRLYAELAPIDIDPIHGMDDPQSPPRQEFKDMLYKWAKVMQGRLSIYDYDQGMLVWRDIPNPSHQSFRQDVQHYRKAGIIGINTESRNAIATTFLNLFMRGQLMWDPDVDVDAVLKDFYPNFFGPAAEPMERYWTTIFDAWANTIVTEHEYFVVPAIFTPEVMAVLDKEILAAEKLVKPVRSKGKNLTRNEDLYLQRMQFMRYSYDITSGYYKMTRLAARECDYTTAAKHGDKALAQREKLTDMNGTFTTYRNYKVEHRGYAWWPGEVKQYKELAPLINGEKGQLLRKLPLDLPFRRDDDDSGLKKGYHTQKVDLSEWKAKKASLTLDNRKDWGDAWEMVSSDLYPHAQGVRHPDRQSYTGHLWYRLDTDFGKSHSSPIRLKFPGLFSECWLYVNGEEVAHRKIRPIWWYNDYRFEWEVDLAGKLKPGENQIALRVNNPHHFGGIFRRPFFYVPVE